MGNLNPADVTFKNLKEKLSEQGYSEEILNEVENILEAIKTENVLSLRGNEILKDRTIVEYFLYACVKENDTRYYAFYGCLQKEVQSDLLKSTYITNNILQTAPEVIEETALAAYDVAILNNITGKPEIAKYISDDLVKNPEFMNQMIKAEPESVNKMFEKHSVEKLITANPGLLNNPQFMSEAIKQDVNVLKYANKEMLNNYDIFSDSSKENDEVANYVLKHIEEFGDNAVKGTKDGTVESLRIDTVKMLKELLEKYDGYSDVERQLKHFEAQDKEGKYPYKAKSLVQAIRKNRLLRLDENELNKIFNIVDLDKELLERQLRENPELVISQEEFGALPTPDELKRMIEKSQVEDKELLTERLEKYKRFHTMVNKEHKSKEKEPKEKVEVPREIQEARETQEERDERLRTPEQEKIATERFMKARKYIGEKEMYRPKPEFLRGLLEKSELKDDKETIDWLEQYTQYYEQIHGRTEEEKETVPEGQTNDEGLNKHNTELHLVCVDFGMDGKVEGRIAMEGVLEPAPEFVNRGIAEHGFPDNTIPENEQTQEQEQETARSVTALRGQKENSRTM